MEVDSLSLDLKYNYLDYRDYVFYYYLVYGFYFLKWNIVLFG